MRHIVRVALCLLISVVGRQELAADERTAAQTGAAKQFSFEGTGLATNLATFLEKYPGAELVELESNSKAGVKTYRVKNLQSADAADYAFLDDTLYSVTAFYTPARLKEMGGDTIPFKKLVQKLGPQDKSSPGIAKKDGEDTFTARWDFAEQYRRISFVAAAKMSYISFVDTRKAALADRRLTEKAELGF